MANTDVGELLKVAEELVGDAKRLTGSDEANARLDVAIDAIRRAEARMAGGAEQSAGSGTFPVAIRWVRPRKKQAFNGYLLPDGRVRLQDGRISSPSGACKILAGGGQFDGWRGWQYWQEDTEEWLPIDELRTAGEFDRPSTAAFALAPLSAATDSVLADLWDNEYDAVYDEL